MLKFKLLFISQFLLLAQGQEDTPKDADMYPTWRQNHTYHAGAVVFPRQDNETSKSQDELDVLYQCREKPFSHFCGHYEPDNVLGAEAWRVYDAKHKELPAEDETEKVCVSWEKNH